MTPMEEKNILSLLQKFGSTVSSNVSTAGNVPVDLKGSGWEARLEFSNNGQLLHGNFNASNSLN